MPRLRRRPAFAAALAAALVVGGSVAAYALPPRQTAQVAVPPASASPEEVVTAYLAALDEHDCATAEAFVEAGRRDQARDWCRDVAGLAHRRLTGTTPVDTESTGRPATDEVVDVGVRFDLDW